MSGNSSNNKRIAKNTIILYIRMILLMIISLDTSRVILDVLGVEDYGIFNVIAGVVSMLGFFTSSLSNASQRYINIGLGKNDVGLTRHYFQQCFTLLFIFSLILLIAGETIGLWFVTNKLVIPIERMNAAFWVYQFSLVTIFCSINQVNFVAAVIAYERMNIFAYFALFDAGVKLLICYMINVTTIDRLITYGCLLSLSSVLVLFIHIIYCIKRFEVCLIRFTWKKSTVREMLSIISANLFGCFAWSMGIQGTNILLNMFFGTIVNAARGIATQINSVVTRFTDNVMTAVKPQIIKSYAEGDYGYMLSLVCKSSRYSFYIFALIAFPVLVETEFLLNLWLKDVPDYSVSFTRLVILETMASVFVNPLWIAVNATGNIKRNQVYGRIFTLMALPLSYVILKIYDNPNAAVLMCTIVQYFYWAYSVYDVKQQLKLKVRDYLTTVVIPSSFILFALLTCSSLINHYWCEVCLTHFIFTTSILIIVGLLSMLAVSSKSERLLLKNYAYTVFRKISN